ncbi:MAG: NAD-dependent epimerase/dehydratase family protein [Patescibacteria group bacterium]|nr:NAD-dependent epimerase/dehydratase family protein [Patescibacteria group bacterium]
MSKILVSGGAGFIGSNLVDKLVELGHQVVVIDSLFSGKKEYLNQSATFYQLDIFSPEVSTIFAEEKFDYVYHLAAQIDVRKSVEDPIFDNQVNILGGLNILSNCQKYKVKKIMFASSGGAIYGFPKEIPTPETYPPYPVSPYGINKLSFEKYLNYYYRVLGQEYVALRLANVYGPRQYKGGEAGVISIFVDNAVNGKKSYIYGDGFQTRDYIYVDDVVNAFISAMTDGVIGEFNIGTGVEKNLLDIILAIENALDQKVEVEYLEPKMGEERRSCLDFSRVQDAIGWKPQIDFNQGIKKTINWSKNNK